MSRSACRRKRPELLPLRFGCVSFFASDMPILLGVQPVHGGVEPVVRRFFPSGRALIVAREECRSIGRRLVSVTPGVQAIDRTLLMRMRSGGNLGGSVAPFSLAVADIRGIDQIPHSFIARRRDLVTSVSNGVPLVRDPVPLVRDPVALVGHVRPLVRRRSNTFHARNLPTHRGFVSGPSGL
jgi:hypothetical protein